MSSGFLRDRTLFHQLGACEYECFRLDGALATDANDRAVLLEILAAGKYLRLVILFPSGNFKRQTPG